MKTFTCSCGQRVFFENTLCTACGRALGYSPEKSAVLSFVIDNKTVGTKQIWRDEKSNEAFKPCQNYSTYNVCNWVLPTDSPDSFCLSCRLNEMIPAITLPQKRRWWASMESAKRRLVVTLLKLKLDVLSRKQSPNGLAFAFLEDKRKNPRVREEYVATGHAQGLITVNLAEADDASRELTRVELGEPYRTLLGHFRHESGHYYFDRLLEPEPIKRQFRRLFGDDRADYKTAMDNYYNNPPPPGWQSGFISDYAQSHPMEDWAECWAHYLHMVDTLETAAEAGIVQHDFNNDDFEKWIVDWTKVAIDLNSLNRSMGLRDAYPFILSEPTLTKIRFVHRVVNPTRVTS